MKMKLAALICTLALVAFAPLAHAGVPCTATTFSYNGNILTAAQINPTGTVRGNVDATGCDIGIYYGPTVHGRVSGANVHGATYFGIVNNGGIVDVLHSAVSEIGDKPIGGGQHGVAIYWVGSNAKGNIQGNFIWDYQKAGIAVRGPTATSIIQNNRVIGLGPVNFIAQTGIEVGLGATTQIHENLVTDNSYTGANGDLGGGILVYGGPCNGGAATINTDVDQNTALNNDVGVWFSNLDGSCLPLSTPTRNHAHSNTLLNNAINNTTGNSPTQGYQAGILDQGDFDVMGDNYICGLGYQPSASTAAVALFTIDVTATNNPLVRANNRICSGPFAQNGQPPFKGHARPSPFR
jgi:hypothetical protein